MSDQFKVSILVELQDRVSGAIKNMSGAMGAMQSKMDGMNGAIGKFKQAAGAYSQLASVGKSIANAGMDGINACIDPAKEYAHQLNLMNMAGLEHLDIQKNIKAAWAVSSVVPTTTATAAIADLMDMRTVLTGKNSAEEGRQLLPAIEKLQSVFKASEHMLGGHSSHDMAFSTIKAIEMMGRTLNEDQIKHQFDEYSKTAIASAGRVLPTHYQQVLKYSKSAKIGLSDQFLQGVVPELIIENQTKGGGGASTVGTQINAGYRLIVEHIMKASAAAKLQNLGLVSKAILDSKGKIKGASGIVGEEVFASNPYQWAMQYLAPALYRKDPSLRNDKERLNTAIAQVFEGNQGAINLLQEMIQKGNAGVITKWNSIRDKVPGLDQSFKQGMQDPEQGWTALAAAMKNLHTAVGQYVLPIVVPAVLAFAAAINQAGQYIQAHPEVGQFIASFMSAMVVVGNAIALVAGLMGAKLAFSIPLLGARLLAFCGWVGVAIGVVTAIILVIQNWGKVTDFVKDVIHKCKAGIVAFTDSFPGLTDNIKTIVSTLKSWADQMDVAVQQVAGFIGRIVSSMFSGLGDWLSHSWMAEGVNRLKNGFGMVDAMSPAFSQYGEKYAAALNSTNLDDRYAASAGKLGLVQNGVEGALASKPKVQVNNHYHHTYKADIKVQGGGLTPGDKQALIRTMAETIEDSYRRSATSHTVAGGVHLSPHHTGAH